MKRFHYIDENEKEQLDLISLFEHCFNYTVSHENIILCLHELEKYITIKAKNENS